MRTIRAWQEFPTRELVQRIRKDKLCLAYINVGQAEEYRTYWRPFWRAPTKAGPGHPDYLVTVDPDGWSDNYPVAYWDMRWRAILWGSPVSLVDMAIADGFDGAYLDWVLAYAEPAVAGLHPDPAGAMIALLRDMRRYARRRRPGFLLIAQNGYDLPRLDEVVDGYSQECLSFTGKAEAGWDDADAGDIPIPDRDERAARAAALRVPVFSVDYALKAPARTAAAAFSRRHGFRPFVSRVTLDRLPDSLP
jgi:cysteinyl-tRNA synthetase